MARTDRPGEAVGGGAVSGISKGSVRVVPAQSEAARRAANSAESARVETAKSGAAARHYAGKDEARFKAESPYLENQVVRVKSGNAEPYKITGGAGSTARRPGEIIERPKGTQSGHAVTSGKNTTKPVK